MRRSGMERKTAWPHNLPLSRDFVFFAFLCEFLAPFAVQQSLRQKPKAKPQRTQRPRKGPQSISEYQHFWSGPRV